MLFWILAASQQKLQLTATIIPLRFMPVFNRERRRRKKENQNRKAEQCMAVKRLFHAVAQQTNHAARSCRTQVKSRAALAHVRRWTFFGCRSPLHLPHHPVCVAVAVNWWASHAWGPAYTVRRLAFREGTVAVWIVQDAQWTCQGGWALPNSARVWQGPDESRSYRWRPVNQGGSWRPG